MNKEEKQAIEKFSNLITKHFEDKKIDSVDYLDYFEGITILNLIDKQQKEIEKLKDEYKREVFEHQEFVEDTKLAVQDYIKKDEIKEKIEELEKPTQEGQCLNVIQGYVREGNLILLKELLGE